MHTIHSQEKLFNIRDYVTFDRNGRAYCPSCEQKKGRRPSQKSLSVLESGAYKCHAGCTLEEIRLLCLGVPKNGSPAVGSTESLHTLEPITKAMDWLLQGQNEESQWARQWLEQRGITSTLMHRNRSGGVAPGIEKKARYC